MKRVLPFVLAVVVFCGVAALTISLITTSTGSSQALKTADLALKNATVRAQLAAKRETSLEAEIVALARQVGADQTAIGALYAQLVALGATPVAGPSPSGSTSPSPATGPSASTPAPVTNPAGRTPPGRQCTVNILGVCVP